MNELDLLAIAIKYKGADAPMPYEELIGYVKPTIMRYSKDWPHIMTYEGMSILQAAGWTKKSFQNFYGMITSNHVIFECIAYPASIYESKGYRYVL